MKKKICIDCKAIDTYVTGMLDVGNMHVSLNVYIL